jgi:hypothetical protein
MADTSPKPFVFVLMPFKSDFDDIYNLGIRPACKAAGTYCERVDEQIFSEIVIGHIYNQIAKADIVVADMSEKNPNVFYETGYAHALGKRTILLTQRSEDIQFDMNQYNHIIYDKSISKLKKQLVRRIRYFLDHPDTKSLVTTDPLEYLVNGINIKTFPIVKIKLADHDGQVGWTIKLDIQNTSEKTINTMQMRFGFLYPVALGEPDTHEHFVTLPDNQFMVNVTDVFVDLLPKFYLHKSIRIRNLELAAAGHTIPRINPILAHMYPCSVRAYTELGMQEVLFTLQVTE